MVKLIVLFVLLMLLYFLLHDVDYVSKNQTLSPQLKREPQTRNRKP